MSALVRITTAPRIFSVPSKLGEAFGFCNFLLGQTNCQIVEPGERHWAVFQRICTEAHLRGGLIADAWYAALAIEWGCEWITFDRDYSRFPDLKWRMPG